MTELRYLAVSGILGAGFPESSLETGLSKGLAFLGCDAGSTDAGPHSLGSGTMMFSRQACMRDLRLAVLGARRAEIPLIIGSSGGSGSNAGVDELMEMVRETSASESLKPFRVARIYTEIDQTDLADRFRRGEVTPLPGAPPVDEKVIKDAERIVGMMSTEPLQNALDQGADVILAGRCSDPAVYAAMPLSKGFDPGVAWHAGKIAECGAAAVGNRLGPDSLLCTLTDDAFIVEPVTEGTACTPAGVGAHGMYENADPYHLVESSGVLDLTNCTYEQHDPTSVRVSGATWVPSDKYTIKLEAAELVGYQTIMLGSIRDPVILDQLDGWIEDMRRHIMSRIDETFGSPEYGMNINVYGRDGTMGQLEPHPQFEGHEAFVLLDVTAGSQDLASSITKLASQLSIHHPVKEWEGAITGIAHPFAPATINRGPLYRFSMNHVVEIEDPLELCRIEWSELSA